MCHMKEILYTKIYIQKYNIVYHKNKKYDPEKKQIKYLLSCTINQEYKKKYFLN